MLVLRFHKLQFYFTFFFIFFYSCEDVNYQLDNEFDPENLGLSSPTIFFHPPEFESIKVGESEASIAEIRKNAMSSIEKVAKDTAKEIISALGAKADAKTISAAVSSKIKG